MNATTITEMHLNTFDRWLVFYSKFVSSTSNQDKVLRLLQWSLLVASVGIANLISRSDEKNRLRKRLHPGIASGLASLYNEVSSARYVIRFLGFPTALEAWRTGSWTYDTNNIVYSILGKILSGSMMLFYPTEFLAFIHWYAPQLYPRGTSPGTGNRLSCLSCRFWAIYVLAELLQCLLLWNDLRTKIQGHESSSNMVTLMEHNVDEEYEWLLHSYKSNLLQIYHNLLFLLPSICWSSPSFGEKPWFPSIVLYTLVWLEAIVSTYQAIINEY
jgi:hypothetical protein